MYGIINDQGVNIYRSRVQRDLDDIPRTIMADTGAMSLSQSEITTSSWSFHTLRGDIEPGGVLFCSALLERYIHKRISELGMGHYRPPVRWYLDVVPTGKPRRALVP